MYRSFSLISTLALLSIPASAEVLNHRDAQHHLTLYQSDLGLVSSRFEAPPVTQTLSFIGLPSALLPASVNINSPSLYTQQWRNTLSFEQRLRQRVGETLTLEHTDTAERISGRLLGFDGAYLEFESDASVMRYPLNGQWQPRLPSYSPTASQLDLELDSASNLTHLDLGYLTRGLSWQTEYQIELQGESSVDLNARAALHNRTDAQFLSTTLDLLAGNPRTPQQVQPMMEMRAMAGVALMADAAPVSEVQGYQLFTLAGQFDLPANSSQRIPLFQAQGLSASVSYQLEHKAYAGQIRGLEQAYAEQRLKFELDESLIDKPLPSGEVSLYKRDSNNRLQFVGSERLGQYSPGQSVELNYGEVFDLRAQRRQTEYQRNGNAFVQGYQVELINGSSETRVVEYLVHVNQQWNLVDASQLATVEGMTARWLIEVPANSSQPLNYTLRLTR